MILDFQKVTSKKDFMVWLSRNFNFPGYFGHNWDAVWDCLRDLEESKTINVLNIDKIYSQPDYLVFKDLINDFNKERKIKITLIEDRA